MNDVLSDKLCNEYTMFLDLQVFFYKIVKLNYNKTYYIILYSVKKMLKDLIV